MEERLVFRIDSRLGTDRRLGILRRLGIESVALFAEDSVDEGVVVLAVICESGLISRTLSKSSSSAPKKLPNVSPVAFTLVSPGLGVRRNLMNSKKSSLPVRDMESSDLNSSDATSSTSAQSCLLIFMSLRVDVF